MAHPFLKIEIGTYLLTYFCLLFSVLYLGICQVTNMVIRPKNKR